MLRTFSYWQALRVAAVALAADEQLQASAAERNDPEVVIEWNELLEGVLPTAGLSPPRHYAMLHIAMFDAINSVERTHRPYRAGACVLRRGASAE